MNTENIIKELKPIDYFIEKSKMTLLFNEDKVLILQDFDDEIMFTFFINNKLIAGDVENESLFTANFKKYLEADS